MFYDVLMEKRAQRAEQNEQERGLSLGQKAGVAGVGLAGAAAPALGHMYSAPTSAFNKFLTTNKYEDKIDALYAESDRIKDSYQPKLAPLKEELANLHNQDMGTYRYNTDGMSREQQLAQKQQVKLERDRIGKLQAEARERLDNITQEMYAKRGKVLEGVDEMKDLSFRSRRNKMLGTMGLAGLAAGYGAKKLFDRYNQRKEQNAY